MDNGSLIQTAGRLLASPLPIVATLDPVRPPHLTGWAVTLRSVRQHSVFLLIDGITVGMLTCNLPRPELVGTEFPFECGFSIEIPDIWLDGKPHTIEFRCPERRDEELRFIYDGKLRNRVVFQDIVKPILYSMVDDVSGLAIIGWVLRETRDGKSGGQTVLITSDGEEVGQVKATRYRPDVAAQHQSDAFCGFRFVAPMNMRRANRQTFRFFVLPEKAELDGSPYTVNLLKDAQQRKLIELTETVERLEDDLRKARYLIDALQPQLCYALDDYHDWALHYFQRLRLREFALADTPLVSIVCPVYRPELEHFIAAVDSVRDQTYTHWQLILVDDGSDDDALSKMLTAYAAADERITVVAADNNTGISAATVRGLMAASGEWVGFLDHDDLLYERAIEIMIAEAQRTGAEMLYSDEDKLDDMGEFTEVHLKPDWNYRYLLTNNYVCHFLMVKRVHLRAAQFDSLYDGAQDHHLVLALSETLAPKQIHHVQEILYHWRKSANSTADDVGAKPGVGLAGVAAVQAHLDRCGAAAEVTTLGATTLYRQRWKIQEAPRVAVIIPLRNRAAMTQQCLDSLDTTDYSEFEVILVDNFSTERDTLSLLHDVAEFYKVYRLEEPFNFSRLNNAACQETDAPYYLFMNNDIVQQRPDWLRLMMDEMLSDDRVAVVGIKLLYPNKFVQHAGVVLGVGGVADHAHRSLPADHPGYQGRALVAQEVSAVTAACMLVKAQAFAEVGGFNEDLAVAFNDVDLCLRLREAGHKIVFTPDVVAIHHESLSRGMDDQFLRRRRFAQETRLMQRLWKDKLADPFYHRFFDLDYESYAFLSQL